MSAVYHDPQNPTTKVCPDCNTEKPLTDFFNGCPRCKECEKPRRKERAQQRLKEFENLPPDTTKICSKCHAEKPIDEFYKQGSGTLGRTARCKICVIESEGYMTHFQKVPLPQNGGKVCHKCHQEKSKDDFNKESARRDGLSLICKECSRTYHNEYEYKTGHRKRSVPLPKPVNGGQICIKCEIEKPWNDFPKDGENKSGYSGKCKECTNVRSRKYYAEPEHKEKKLVGNQQWYENNKARHRELVKKWTNDNRLVANAIFARHRARKMAAMVQKVDYIHILERDNCWCYICDGEIREDHKIDFDHVIPLSRGGVHAENNVKVTHHKCNRRKHTKLLEEMTPHQRRGVK
jgi:hypothetical protein